MCALESSHLNYEVKKCSFKSLKFQEQKLIFYETPEEIQDFKHRARIHGTRFLFMKNIIEEWIDIALGRLPSSNSLLLWNGFDRGNMPAVCEILCEVVNDPATLLQVDHFTFELHDLKNIRFRMDLRDYAPYRCELGNVNIEDEWQLRKDFDNRQNIGPVKDEESFDLAQMPDDLLIHVMQLSKAEEIFRLKYSSKQFYAFTTEYKHCFHTRRQGRLLIQRDEDERGVSSLKILIIVDLELLKIDLDSSVGFLNYGLPRLRGWRRSHWDFLDWRHPEDQGDKDYESGSAAFELKPMFEVWTLEGMLNAKPRTLSKTIRCVLSQVLTKLAKFFEITSLEFKNMSQGEIQSVLPTFPSVKELHIGKTTDAIRTPPRQTHLTDVLPLKLESLSLCSGPILQDRSRFLNSPRVQSLKHLDLYGSENPSDNVFRTRSSLN